MAKKEKEKAIDSLIFLFPSRLIRKNHISKKDAKIIKDNLTRSFSLLYLIIAIVVSVLIGALMVFMNIASGGKIIETYGIIGFVGQIFLFSCTSITVVLSIAARSVSKQKTSIILSRTAGNFLYIGVLVYMLCCFFTDAQMGFTINSETLSAGIIFIAILLLIQPTHWIDAFVLDALTSIGIFATALAAKIIYNMGAIHYYGIVALVFPFAAYLIISLLFYAESQRYKEELENEQLHNRAYYDSLTRCKNRHALTEFLRENQYRWDKKDNVNLLMILFDIDNFKLYNDQFSHLGGDYCLKSICDAIRREFPSPNLDFFRYGGEEFLLFFELKNPDDAPTVLEKVRESISNLDMIAPKGAPKKMVTISVGGMLLRNVKGFEFEHEMRIVDEYLYKAKNSGKDVVCYNGQLIN